MGKDRIENILKAFTLAHNQKDPFLQKIFAFDLYILSRKGYAVS